MTGTDHAELRRSVVAVCGQAAERGLVIGTAGNVSARVGSFVAVTATGADFAALSDEHVSVVDLEGRLVAGDLEPTSELGLHLDLHRGSEQDQSAVVHTHAPVSTALSTVLTELPVIHYQQLALGGPVRVAPYATFGTSELADQVREALDGRKAALMANHGSVAVGATPDQALEHALLLEWLCTVYRDACVVGTPAVLDAKQQEAVVLAAIERRYGTTRPAEEAP